MSTLFIILAVVGWLAVLVFGVIISDLLQHVMRLRIDNDARRALLALHNIEDLK